MHLTGFTSLSVLFFSPYRSPSFSLCTGFDSISCIIDEVLSINPPANVFVFEVDQKDWLTYSGGTDKSGELYFNFSITNDLSQIFNFIQYNIPNLIYLLYSTA